MGKLVLAVARPPQGEGAESSHAAVGHAAVGAYLLGVWGVPQQVVEAVAYHHQPREAPHPAFDVVAAVHIADALVREREAEVSGRPGDVGHAILDEEYVRLVGAEDRLPQWRAAAVQLVKGGQDGADTAAAGPF